MCVRVNQMVSWIVCRWSDEVSKNAADRQCADVISLQALIADMVLKMSLRGTGKISLSSRIIKVNETYFMSSFPKLFSRA